jgi:hypothetical protein
MSNLSRRSLISSAAALPALALPAVAAAAAPSTAPAVTAAALARASDPVFALAERVMQTHDAHSAACEARSAPEEALFEWRKNNPPPDESDLQAPEWRRRRRAAEQRTGFAKAEANQSAACDAAWDAIDTLRDTVPQAFAGLAAKARAWR